MATEQQANLVRSLFGGTQLGTITWESTASGDAFEVILKTGSIRIMPDDRDIWISVLNKDGVIVDSFNDRDLADSQYFSPNMDGWYPFMKELLEMARRNALGADQVLSNILQEIEKTQKRGRS